MFRACEPKVKIPEYAAGFRSTNTATAKIVMGTGGVPRQIGKKRFKRYWPAHHSLFSVRRKSRSGQLNPTVSNVPCRLTAVEDIETDVGWLHMTPSQKRCKERFCRTEISPKVHRKTELKSNHKVCVPRIKSPVANDGCRNSCKCSLVIMPQFKNNPGKFCAECFFTA